MLSALSLISLSLLVGFLLCCCSTTTTCLIDEDDFTGVDTESSSGGDSELVGEIDIINVLLLQPPYFFELQAAGGGSVATELPKWNLISGSWNRQNNELICCSDNSVFMFKTKHPQDKSAAFVQVDIWGETGDEFKVFINSNSDGSVAYYAKITIGNPNGCVELYNSGGNLLSENRWVIDPNRWLTINIAYGKYPGSECFFGASGGYPNEFQNNITIIVPEEIGENHAYVGLGTGNIAACVKFDNFKFYRFRTNLESEATCPFLSPLCTYFSDLFTRSSGFGLGCSYNLTGPWTIVSSGNLGISEPGKVIINTVQPYMEAGLELQIAFAGSPGDIIKLTIGGNTALITLGSAPNVFDGNLVLTSPDDTVTLPDFNFNVFNPFRLCAANNLLSFNGNNVGIGSPLGHLISCYSQTPRGITDTEVSFEVVSCSGQVTFRNIAISSGKRTDGSGLGGCRECGGLCTKCGDYIDSWTADLTGFILQNGSFGNCNQIGAEFVLTRNPLSGNPGANSIYSGAAFASFCTFKYLNTNWSYPTYPACDANRVANTLWIGFNPSGNPVIPGYSPQRHSQGGEFLLSVYSNYTFNQNFPFPGGPTDNPDPFRCPGFGALSFAYGLVTTNLGIFCDGQGEEYEDITAQETGPFALDLVGFGSNGSTVFTDPGTIIYPCQGSSRTSPPSRIYVRPNN